jgi:hypothetical protein
MSAPTRKSTLRRGCRIVVAVAVVACASGFAWYWHSRLNPLERRMLGDWSFVRTDKIRIDLRFQSDRTFRCLTSRGVEDSGTWKISGDDLIFSSPALFPPPKSAWSLIQQEVDRLQNPALADSITTFALEDISRSVVRVHDKQVNAEIVLRRVDSAGD